MRDSSLLTTIKEEIAAVEEEEEEERRKRVDEGKISHFREVEICSTGMPRHCSAGGCKSRDNRETRNAGITFHKLPKGRTRRNLWINNSHRADSWDPQTDFVYFCSKHFTPESFELTGCSGIRRLKEDAFPTVFESSSTIKFKRARTQQIHEDVPGRKSPCRGGQETDQGQTSKEPKVPKLLVADEQGHENIPDSPQETSRVEQLPKQESSSPPSECRPPSPSRYMRRLPPPPGSYLSKEHSYAQLCPLLWRRRYDQAIDCLEKALRQLHAARRRENRLRSTVLRLRDKRLKQTLFVSQDGKAGGNKGRGKGGCNQEESENDVKSEYTGLFEDRCFDNSELGAHFPPDNNSWSEEDRGYCLYCGRGQVQVGGQVTRTLSKTVECVQPTDHDDSLKILRNVETSTWGPDENTRGIQIVRLERPLKKNVETSGSQVLLNHPSLQHAVPARLCQPDTREQSLQFLESEQKVLLSDTCRGEYEAVSQEHHIDLQQFVMQGYAEGQFILVPVPDEDELQSFLKMEEDTEVQTVYVSDHNDSGHMMEHNGGLTRAGATCDDENSDQDSVISSSTLLERREDVREKLKEHLEGFHLQLSSEFVN
ncbi:THAP domain-containing protein 7 [Channa argus]|uniref:THAP domain-containing protein 7 n=1 Tax=Channa argus TaxID=215402 RepID=A0A6G1R017_CHAAH|nr:THAP domain-containing protein 7 [Channa argus]